MGRRKQVGESDATGLASPVAQTIVDELAAQIKTPAEFQVIYRQF